MKFSYNQGAFQFEIQRQILASQRRLSDLLKLYSKTLPYKANLNKPQFWNNIYLRSNKIGNSNGMAKDRLRTAISFIPKRSLSLLDLGIGTGILEEQLLRKNKFIKIIGIDIAKSSINLVRSKIPGKFFVSDVDTINFPSNSFDIIVALELIEHLPPHSSLQTLKKINKWLKRDGSIIVSVPLNEEQLFLKNNYENPNHHVRMYTKELLTAELALAGFSVCRIKTLFAFKNLYFLKK